MLEGCKLLFWEGLNEETPFKLAGGGGAEEPMEDSCYLNTIIVVVICLKKLKNFIYCFFVAFITTIYAYLQEIVIFLL